MPHAGEETRGSVRSWGAGVTQDGAQSAPEGSSEGGSRIDRLWPVHMKTVAVLMA